MGDLGRPHYFGPVERRSFSFVHWPTGAIRGGALICPPLAYEAVCAHPSLRLLAERLASLGVVAMRIDYDGTSNSIGGERDGGRVAAWQRSIVDAAAELRSWQVDPIHVVGLRFGATLASEMMPGIAGLAGAVLWDPVVSGRRYSRELMMLGGSSGLRADPAEDGISVAGIAMSNETLTEMKSTKLLPLGVPGLVILRSERPDPPESPDHFGPDVELLQMEGTAAMLDTDAELARPPLVILDAIAGWIDRRLPSAGARIDAPMMTSEALDSTDDTVLVHSAARVGPTGLFCICTSTRGQRPVRAVIMLNNGLAPMIGPGRSWVELARQVSTRGWTAIRADLSGIGDSPAREGAPDGESYPTHAGPDIAAIVEGLKADGVQQIAVLGLCSGAILAFDGALATDLIDVIISVNGRFDRPFFDRRRHSRLRAAPHTNRLLAVPLRKTPLLKYFAMVPTFIWRILDRLRIVPDPTHAIRGFVANRKRVLLIFGEREWGLVALRQRGGKRFAELVDDQSVQLALAPGLDHSMFDLVARTEVLGQVIDFLGDAWPETEPSSP